MKSDLRVKKTYKFLSEALISLLEDKDFEQIKVNEICEKAMVHKATFYNHFSDKYELLSYIINEIQNHMLKELELNKTDSIFDYYINLAKIYMKHIRNNKNIYKSIINTNSTCFDIIYNLAIKDIEEKSQKNENDNIPLYYISNFYVSAVLSTINIWFNKGMKENEEQMADYLKILIERKNN